MSKNICDCKKKLEITNLIIILGSKECFEEPKDLTQKVRDALRQENPKNTSNTDTSNTDTSNTDTSNTDSASSTDSSADESVKKRDKV